jgi:enoyl-CoA hydratase
MNVDARPTTHIELTRDEHVATVRFTADAGPPLLSSPALGELGSAVERIAEDANIRFVVFRGSGDVFNGGADVGEVMHMDEDQGLPFSQHGQHVFDAIENLPQITFAAINGHAMGGGCELAMACSFRIMVAGAQIGLPEVKFGVIPAWGATKRLPLLVPFNWALRMLYSGESIAAEQAEQIGLIDEVVPSPDHLDEALRRWFKRFNHCAPQAIIRIKRAIIHDDESHQFGLCFTSEDPREGMQAFFEKRKPRWVPKDNGNGD